MQRTQSFSNFKRVHARDTRVHSLSKHYATKKTRITREDVNKAIEEAVQVSNTHMDKKYVAAQWDVAHEIFVHYARQEKYLAEERMNYDVLEAYCELDQSSLECREYDL